MTAALMGQAAPPGVPAAPLPGFVPMAEAGFGGAGDKPPALPAPRGGRADDLRRIKGVGIKNEGVLNALGIFHYDQVAAFTPANVEWLDAYLKSYGRIAREDWVGQAKALLAERAGPSTKIHPDDAGV
jgi:NADH-quinone oxidoreductase subunit E